MGYFKNLLNLKNVIVGNRSSIDEIRDLKKLTASKILQGNTLLGLDIIAYDSNYNRLDASEASTIFLYEELKKNSLYRNNHPTHHYHHHQLHMTGSTAALSSTGYIQSLDEAANAGMVSVSIYKNKNTSKFCL
jgi:hypothetical protein